MGFNAEKSVVAGTSLVIDAIQSSDYSPGVSGWIIRQDGTSEFNNGSYRGTFQVGASPGGYILIFNFNGTRPEIDLYPGDFSDGNTWAKTGFISATKQQSPTHWGRISIGTPQPTGGGQGLLDLTSGTAEGNGSTANFTFDQLLKNGNDIGGGRVMSASLSAITTAIGTTETTVLTTPSKTYAANRCYEIRSKALAQASTSGAGINVMVRKANVSGLLLSELGRIGCPTSGIYFGQAGHGTFVTGSNTVTTAMSISIRASTGTGTLLGSGDGSRSEWSIYDVGDAASQLADDPNTPVLV